MYKAIAFKALKDWVNKIKKFEDLLQEIRYLVHDLFRPILNTAAVT